MSAKIEIYVSTKTNKGWTDKKKVVHLNIAHS